MVGRPFGANFDGLLIEFASTSLGGGGQSLVTLREFLLQAVIRGFRDRELLWIAKLCA